MKPMTLREWLKSVGKRPDDIALDIGVTRRTVYKYLAGERFPKPEMIRRIQVVTNGNVTAMDWHATDSAACREQVPRLAG